MTGVVVGHVLVWVILVVVLLGLIALAVLRPSPKWLARSVGSGGLARLVAYGLGGIVALYLVGRAVAEFFTVDYSNPASYRDSWGGPSLVGVFLVHAGPGAAIVVAVIGYLFRWWPPSRRTAKANETTERGPQRQIRSSEFSPQQCKSRP
jgi:hypothetical protein